MNFGGVAKLCVNDSFSKINSAFYGHFIYFDMNTLMRGKQITLKLTEFLIIWLILICQVPNIDQKLVKTQIRIVP